MTRAALASAVEMPEHRLPGLPAVVPPVLNGRNPSLDRQDAASTVVLIVPMLKEQLELG